MSSAQSIKALEEYREVLGDDLVEFFTGLWTLQDTLADIDMLDALRSTITFLDTYHEGFRDAMLPLFADDFSLENIDPITAQGVEDLVNTLIETCDVDSEDVLATHLALAVVSVVQPKAMRGAQDVEAPDKSSLETGECPACGAPAAMGILRDEGQAHGGSRELWCALCDYHWAFPRIKCARCGNVRQKELEYFFVEGDNAHRVYGCGECGGTLKVVDEASLGHACDPRVEDIVLEGLLDAVVEGAADSE